MPSLAPRTTGLTYRFGTHTAVDHVDLRIERGETFGLLGPNGAGKTTTIRMLTTLLRPMEGTISVFGVNTADRPMLVRRMIGYVPLLIGTPAHLGLDLTVLAIATVVGVAASAALLPRLAR